MGDLPHLDGQGAARMVGVGAKPVTARRAIAEGRIRMTPAALEAVRTNNAPKGDVLGAARIAGIMAAKRTSDLLPLCHPLALEGVAIGFTFGADFIAAEAAVDVTGRTGAEMEALTAASVALLTIYDMAKALDKAMVIEGVRLLVKNGGASGEWTAPA